MFKANSNCKKNRGEVDSQCRYFTDQILLCVSFPDICIYLIYRGFSGSHQRVLHHELSWLGHGQDMAVQLRMPFYFCVDWFEMGDDKHVLLWRRYIGDIGYFFLILAIHFNGVSCPANQVINLVTNMSKKNQLFSEIEMWLQYVAPCSIAICCTLQHINKWYILCCIGSLFIREISWQTEFRW